MKEIVLSFHKEVIFKAVFVDLDTYRVVIDEIDLENTIKELIVQGSISLNKVDEIKHENYNQPVLEADVSKINDLDELLSYISNLGYDSKVSESSSYVTLRAKGKSLHPDIISQTNDNRISLFAINLIKVANNITYEPPLFKSAGSFKIEVMDNDLEKDNVKNAISELKKLTLDNVNKYTSIISKLEDIARIKDFEKLVIDDFKLSISKDEIKKMSKIKSEFLKNDIKTLTLNNEKLRNFDPHNYAFKGDLPKTIYFKMDENIFNLIYENYLKQKKGDFNIKGYFTKKASFTILNFMEDK